jgi:predicted DNA-binding protein YlxM (UPF0122 family)
MVDAMHYLTRSEYAKLKNISRQAVHNRIARGTLLTVRKKVERDEELIPVDDKELEGVNPESLTA